jgi:hypothetical protein
MAVPKKVGEIMHMHGVPYIQLTYWASCPKCGHNSSPDRGQRPVYELLEPPLPEPRFECPYCFTRFDIAVTSDRKREIEQGLELLEEAKRLENAAAFYFQDAAKLLNNDCAVAE